MGEFLEHLLKKGKGHLYPEQCKATGFSTHSAADFAVSPRQMNLDAERLRVRRRLIDNWIGEPEFQWPKGLIHTFSDGTSLEVKFVHSPTSNPSPMVYFEDEVGFNDEQAPDPLAKTTAQGTSICIGSVATNSSGNKIVQFKGHTWRQGGAYRLGITNLTKFSEHDQKYLLGRATFDMVLAMNITLSSTPEPWIHTIDSIGQTTSLYLWKDSQGVHMAYNGCEAYDKLENGIYPAQGSTLKFATGGLVSGGTCNFQAPPAGRGPRECTCPDCYGTGYYHGWGGPCPRGCEKL